jgi:hypothetical protein
MFTRIVCLPEPPLTPWMLSVVRAVGGYCTKSAPTFCTTDDSSVAWLKDQLLHLFKGSMRHAIRYPRLALFFPLSFLPFRTPLFPLPPFVPHCPPTNFSCTT